MNALDPLVWSVLLMLVGCVVLVLEVFIPSGGLLAVISAAAFVGSIVIAFQRGPVTGFTFVMSTVVAVPLVLALAFHYWPKTKIGKAFLGELPRDEDVLPDDPHRVLMGRVGVARSKMLPSGAVEIDGQMIDALSQGQAIEPDNMSSLPRSAPTASWSGRPKRTNARAGRRTHPTCSAARSKSWGSSRSRIRWRDAGHWCGISSPMTLDAAPVYTPSSTCFDPTCGDSWTNYIAWSGLRGIREVVSIDGMLCPAMIRDLSPEDWQHNVQEELPEYTSSGTSIISSGEQVPTAGTTFLRWWKNRELPLHSTSLPSHF